MNLIYLIAFDIKTKKTLCEIILPQGSLRFSRSCTKDKALCLLVLYFVSFVVKRCGSLCKFF